MYIVTRVHPNVIATKNGPAVSVWGRRGPQPIHLRQGQMDGACGPHCVMMALLALRVVRRGWVTNSPSNAPRAVKAALRLTSKWYFCGTAVRDLAKLVQPLHRSVTASISKASHAAVVPFILDNLAEERLVIVGINNGANQLKHWTLAVGVAGVQKRDNFQPQHFLLLDPSEDPISLLQWNSTLAVTAARPRSRARLWHERNGKSTLVTLQHALAIGRRDKWGKEHE
jgi:hypothetical protein